MIEWRVSKKVIPFGTAVRQMQERSAAIYYRGENQLIWMLEHPNVYTGGTSSKEEHLLQTGSVPVEKSGRGGSYTFHGPGQRVVYVLLDLRNHGKDIRKFVWNLEEWIILSLSDLGIIGERRPDRIGIWVLKGSDVQRQSGSLVQPEYKIASIGLRVKRWISLFGFSINVNPDLSYFDGIIPCGNSGFGVTSLHDLGLTTSLTDLDKILKRKFDKVFQT